MNIKHYRSVFFFALMNLPMKRTWRWVFAKLGGVRIAGKGNSIGKNVRFDSIHPEDIIIKSHVRITNDVVFLTHYLDTDRSDGVFWKDGIIEIGEGTFVGTRTIITKPVKIGKNVIIGAGSVVTKDIPDNEIWAGNPAKKLKSRTINSL